MCLCMHIVGNIANLFSGSNYLSNRAIVEHRLKKLTFVCLQAVYQNRYAMSLYNFQYGINYALDWYCRPVKSNHITLI